MKPFIIGAGLIIGSVFVAGGIDFLATGESFLMYKYWAPKQENVRREVFENTDSFVRGKIAHIAQLELDYEQSQSTAQKGALRRMVLTEAAEVDNSKLPASEQEFISSLKGGL
jgi:hypothetical protein